MAEPDLDPLIAAIVDDSASEEQCRELSQALATQPALRATVANQLLVDRLLYTMGRPSLNADVLLSALPAQSRPLSGRVMDRIAARNPHWWQRRTFLSAAAIFLLLGLTAVYYALRPPDHPLRGTANLLLIKGDVSLIRNNTRRALKLDESIVIASDILVTSPTGTVRLQYNDGTELQLQPDTTLVVSSIYAEPAQPHLKQGSFTAYVAKQPASNPMRFETPWSTIDVLGTQFELSVTKEAATVNVHEGRVRLTSRINAESREIGPGERGTVSAAGDVYWEYTSHRDPLIWPFATHSPWNYPLGSGALFIAAATENFPLTRGAKTNIRLYGHPIFVAEPTDPERVIENKGGIPLLRARIPDAAKADPSELGALHIIDPRARTVLELTSVERRANGALRTVDFALTDLTGSGFGPESIRISGASGLGGLIRRGELKNGIRHALALSVIRKALHRKNGPGTAFTWPASRAPSFVGLDTTGPRYLGTLLALPPDVDLTKLGVGTSGAAYEVARALQDYGGYIVESFQDANNDVDFFVEPAAESEVPADFDALLSRIIPHLKIVSNNSPERMGGGGVPRRPFAPALETSKRDADF